MRREFCYHTVSILGRHSVWADCFVTVIGTRVDTVPGGFPQNKDIEAACIAAALLRTVCTTVAEVD